MLCRCCGYLGGLAVYSLLELSGGSHLNAAVGDTILLSLPNQLKSPINI